MQAEGEQKTGFTKVVLSFNHFIICRLYQSNNHPSHQVK